MIFRQAAKYWIFVLVLCGTMFGAPARAGIVQGLSFGILPYKAPQRILSDLAPLTDHLSQRAGRPVLIQTARDYAEFVRRMHQGEYDVLLTAPHFARMMEGEGHYQAIAMTRYQVQALLLVPAGSPIHSVAQLQGKVLAMPQRESLIYLLGLDLLRAQGLEPGRNITLREYPSNQLALAAPLRNDSDASVGGVLVWRTSGMQNDLRILAESKPMPGLVLMAHNRLPPLTVQNLRSAALEFNNMPEGAAYLKASGHLAWLPMTPDTLRGMDAYARRVSR